MIGTTFGNYRIEEKLGEGGMGVVYRAVDTELDRPVAIKTLISTGSEDDLARFMREARAASRLQHPAIVTIHHFGVEGTTRYLVMEYMEGKTLKRMCGGRPLPLVQLCEIGIQVADGLAAAHEKGIIHRDMKAENVMVNVRGQAKILDFGLAKLREPDLPGKEFQTQVGVVMGTVSHMSPEQALGAEVDTRTDIFSFGVMMYELATGKMPFHAATPQAILARILNQEPAPPSDLNQDMPPELEHLILRCLEKNRVNRPTANEVVTELKRVRALLSAKELGSGGTPALTIKSGATGRISSGAVPSVVVPSSGAMRASGGMAAAAAAAALKPPAPAVTPAERARAKIIYALVNSGRLLFALATLIFPLAFFLYFVLTGGLIRAELVEGTIVLTVVEAIVGPALGLADKIFTFRMVLEGWNFMAVMLGVIAIVLRQLLMWPVDMVEHWAKTKMVRATATTTGGMQIQAVERAAADRMAKLREYTDAKRQLFEQKRNLAFLSIDVVGSTRMKVGEDKLVVEHAFAEYKRFIERILNSNNLWKVAWTPDGIMCAFPTPDDAVKAGQDVLKGLPWFNDGVHQLKTPFTVRVGVNAGEVVFPEDKQMEEISDEIIDVAGHMQKYAAPGALWIGRDVLPRLANSAGFQQMANRQVDGRDVFEWRSTERTATVALPTPPPVEA